MSQVAGQVLRGFVGEGLPLWRGAALASPIPPRLSQLKFIDIGANLLDDMFSGVYNEKQRHEADLPFVVDRAKSCGLERVICTAGTSEDSARALRLASLPEYSDFLSSTVGVHPTQCNEFAEGKGEAVIENLSRLIAEANVPGQPRRVVALGECGLDYARLQFCPRELQLLGFQQQLDLAERADLPLFLHSRDTDGEFLRIVRENRHKLRRGGVVHSFDGSMEEMRALTDELGLHIGINGCSLRSEESLLVAAAVPEHLLLLETDAPWCGIKPTHPSHAHVGTTFPTRKKEKYAAGVMVKDRNEPCTLRQVFEVVAAVRGLGLGLGGGGGWGGIEGEGEDAAVFALAERVLANTRKLFFSEG